MRSLNVRDAARRTNEVKREGDRDECENRILGWRRRG